MPELTIAANACSQIVKEAARSCQPGGGVTPIASQAASPNWDAMAVALTSQANAISWGAVLFALLLAAIGFAWGKALTISVKSDARETAEKELSKWLREDGIPMVRRDVGDFLRTFPRERPISDDEVTQMVAAAGADGKEGDDGKK